MIKILSNLIYPSPYLLIGVMVMIFIDLLTGITKATRQGKATTSRGLRNSFDKATTYFSLIMSLSIMVSMINISDQKHLFSTWLQTSVNALMLACCYVEFKSILENLIIIGTDENGNKNFMASMILTPIHNFIIFKFNKTSLPS